MAYYKHVRLVKVLCLRLKSWTNQSVSIKLKTRVLTITSDSNGRPQNALRVSFGYHNTMDDIVRFTAVFKTLSIESLPRDNFVMKQENNISIKRLYTYPIKSCGALKLETMSFNAGLPENDRLFTFAMEKSGRILDAKTNPKVAQISLQLENNNFSVRIPNDSSWYTLSNHGNIDEDVKESNKVSEQDVNCNTRVCLRKVQMESIQSPAIPAVSEFLSEKIKILKIKNSVDGLTLQMKSPLLAICTASLEWLNDRLANPTSLEKLELRFRPNIVIKTSIPFEEESWKKIKIGEAEFEVEGNCTRCGAVCIDPETGTRQKEPLETITKSRNETTFGIYIKLLSTDIKSISTSDSVQTF